MSFFDPNVMKLLDKFLPIFSKYQNIKISKLIIKIQRKPDATYLKIETDENSKEIGSALVDIMTVVTNMIKTQDTSADIQVIELV